MRAVVRSGSCVSRIESQCGGVSSCVVPVSNLQPCSLHVRGIVTEMQARRSRFDELWEEAVSQKQPATLGQTAITTANRAPPSSEAPEESQSPNAGATVEQGTAGILGGSSDLIGCDVIAAVARLSATCSDATQGVSIANPQYDSLTAPLWDGSEGDGSETGGDNSSVQSCAVALGSAIGRDLYWSSAGHLLALGVVRWAEGVHKRKLDDVAVPIWVRTVVRPQDIEAEHLSIQSQLSAGVIPDGQGALASHGSQTWGVAPTGGIFVDVDLTALGVTSSQLSAASKAISKRAIKEARSLARAEAATPSSSPGLLRRLSLPLDTAAQLFGDTDPVIVHLKAQNSHVCAASSFGGLVLPSELVPGSARVRDASQLIGPQEILGVSQVALQQHQEAASSRIDSSVPSAAPSKHEEESDLFTRVSAVAWPSKALMSEWTNAVAEAERRDHRRVGQSQHLWSLHASSPGSPFFLPHGERLLARLRHALRSMLAPRGYNEVTTPQLFEPDLWKTSGHWQNYREDMYVATGADHAESSTGVLGLKPMNCPAHCVVFGVQTRSHRDLPLRVSDFGALHRNEASGALTGLTRVRRFHQDDAHIFCAAVDDSGEDHSGEQSVGLQQVRAEVLDCLGMVQQLYRQGFGLGFSMRLATRPEKHLGSEAEWEAAEEALRSAMMQALQDSETPTQQHRSEDAARSSPSVVVEPDAVGDGAFYGPKIDITAMDALGRQHQCATIQLDFQLAGRFGLEYSAADGSLKTPVIVHRALLGSFERMLAVLAEHFAGRWPLWLCPRQLTILPIPGSLETGRRFAEAIAAGSVIQSALSLRQDSAIHQATSGVNTTYSHILPLSAEPSAVMVEYDPSSRSLGKRIREAQMQQSGLIGVVGEVESASTSLAVRFRDESIRQAFATSAAQLCAAINMLQAESEYIALPSSQSPPGAVALQEAAQLMTGLTPELKQAVSESSALQDWAVAHHDAAPEPIDTPLKTHVLLVASTVRVATAMRL